MRLFICIFVSMKLNLSLFVVFIAFACVAQNPAPGQLMNLLREESSDIDSRETIIWSEDFINGIPAGWENAENGGIAAWEYRGPLTIPNNEEGSRGSCIADGTTGAVLLSPTWSNGFMIFDSNWWDNPDNPCTDENMGTGPAPGPHFATLTTSTIDLTGYPDVALRFNQYRRNLEADMRVEISVNNGLWLEIYNNDNTEQTSALDMQVQIPVSSLAGNQSNVKFRFVFDGLYYFWQLDDLCVVDIPANDLATSESTYGDFDFYDPAHPTGYEYMQYTKYPDEMAPFLKFSTQATNVGSLLQNACVLQVSVENVETNDVIHSATSVEAFDIPSATTLELRAGSFQMPADLANYRVVFTTDALQEDENPLNNTDTLGFQITNSTYARDYNFTTAIYIPSPDLAALEYEVGNVFLVTAPGQSCYSISAAVGVGTVLPTTMFARLYEFDAQQNVVATLLGTTSTITIDETMINDYGMANFVHLNFDTPIAVEDGMAYLAVVGSVDGGDNLVVAFSGGTEIYSSWAHFLPDTWYTLGGVPMVRMNFGTDISVPSITPENAAITCYPNPASDAMQIRLSGFDAGRANMCIYDAAGSLVRKDSFFISAGGIVVSVADLESGMYQLAIVTDNKSSSAMIVIQR